MNSKGRLHIIADRFKKSPLNICLRREFRHSDPSSSCFRFSGEAFGYCVDGINMLLGIVSRCIAMRPIFTLPRRDSYMR